jgi:uncharacterized protein YtpQ (UPF0354 family)
VKKFVSAVEAEMKFPVKFILLAVLPAMVLLALAGCAKAQPVDPTRYNAADWEKQIKDPSLTEAEFTRLYALAAAAELTNCTVRVTGRKEVTLKFNNGGQVKSFLDNVWAEAEKNAAARPEICRRYLATLVTLKIGGEAKSAPPDTNEIVVVIRGTSFLEQFAGMGATKTNGLVFEPLAADINVVYARDREGTIVYLTEGDRAALGLDLPALRRLALANLHRILPPLKLRGPGPLFAIKADGNYESSLLLLDKLWSVEASSVQGELVAAVPARGFLLFTGSASPEGLKRLRRLVEKVYDNGDHVISKTLLVRRNGHWEKFSD